VTARFFFSLMIATTLLSGMTYARQAEHSAPPQQPSQSGATSAPDHLSEGQQNDRARAEQGKDLTSKFDGGDKVPKRVGRVTPHRPIQTNSNRASTHPLHPAKSPAVNSARSDSHSTVTGTQQTDKKTAVAGLRKTNGHGDAITPPQTIALNGQRFRNSRDPGARLAISGGPVTEARGTAAINGNDMKRKP
jgi:hypothetical protein